MNLAMRLRGMRSNALKFPRSPEILGGGSEIGVSEIPMTPRNIVDRVPKVPLMPGFRGEGFPVYQRIKEGEVDCPN